MNRDIHSRGYNSVDRVQSRDSLALANGNREWIGPNEKLVLEYIYKNGLKMFKPAFLKELGIDMKRRIYDVLNRLTSRGVLRKKVKGLYEVVEEALAKFIDYPTRNLNNTNAKPVKGSRRTSPPWDARGIQDVRGSRDGVQYIGPVVHTVGSRHTGGDLLFSGRATGSQPGMGAGGVNARPVGSTHDPLFFDHVVGFKGEDFVYGDRDKHGNRRLKWRDLVFYERIVSAEVGAYIDIPNWDGVLKIYWPANEPSVVVEWQHPKGFLREHSLLELRKTFWERVVSAIIALSKLVLSYGPYWAVRRLVRELRARDICRGVVHV